MDSIDGVGGIEVTLLPSLPWEAEPAHGYHRRMRLHRVPVLTSLCMLFTAACDPTLTEEAKAGCEEATDVELHEGSKMLPGRDCISCHDKMTAAGTVFPTETSACNGTGVARVKVEILDQSDNVALTLTTNSAGNFYTEKSLPKPYRARITSRDGTVMEMDSTTDQGNCTRCHRVPGIEDAQGRIALMLVSEDDQASAATSPTPDAGR